MISFADEEDEEENGASLPQLRRKGIRAQHEVSGKPAKQVISQEQLEHLKNRRDAQLRTKSSLEAKIKEKVLKHQGNDEVDDSNVKTTTIDDLAAEL